MKAMSLPKVEVEYRVCGPEDRAEVMGFCQAMAKEAKVRLDEDKTWHLLPSILEKGIVIRLDSGIFVGIISPPWYNNEPEAHDLFLYVPPEDRRHGLGTKLLKAYRLEAEKRGIRRIFFGVSTGISVSCPIDAGFSPIGNNFQAGG